jgi:hypothetical protein
MEAVKLNQLFDNEHRRDGERTSEDTYRLAREISDSPAGFSRNAKDLAALVIKMNYHYMKASREVIELRDKLKAVSHGG